MHKIKLLLIGIANGLAHGSSIWPQLWLVLIRQKYLTYSQIMFIWGGLAVSSLILGFFIMPWHNVPNTYSEIEQQGIDTFQRQWVQRSDLLHILRVIIGYVSWP